MALDFQLLPVKLTGLNQENDPQTLQPGELVTLENMQMDKTGRLKKRYGYDNLGAFGLQATAIADWNGDLAIFANGNIKNIDGSNSTLVGDLFSRGHIDIYSLGGAHYSASSDFDYAEGADYGVGVRQIGVNSFDVSFYRLDNKKRFYSFVLTATRAKITSNGTKVVLFFANYTEIKAYTYSGYDVNGYPNSASTTIEAYSTTNNIVEHLDAICTSNGTYAVLIMAYNHPAPTTETRAYVLNISGAPVLTGPVSTGTGTPDLVHVAARRTANVVALVYWNDTRTYNAFYRDLNCATLVLGTETTIDAFTSGATASAISFFDDGSTLFCFVAWLNRATSPGGAGVTLLTDNGGWSVKSVLKRAALASRVFLDAATSAPGIYLAKTEVSTEIVNNAIVGIQFSATGYTGLLEYALPSQGRPIAYQQVIPHAKNASGLVTCAVKSIGSAETESRLLVRTPTSTPQFVMWNGSLLNNYSPNIRAFDGARNQLVGWPIYPEAALSLTGSGGAGSYPSATYGIRLCYVRYDKNGNVYRSAPSLVYSAASGGAYAIITITHYPYPFYQDAYDDDAVWLEVYRTVGNGAIYYLDGTTKLFDAGWATVSYQFQTSETDLPSKQLLYTEGGIIENIGPPSVKQLAVVKDRLWAVASDGSPWFSRKRIQYEGVSFSDAFILNELASEDLTAVQEMDDKIVFLYATSIKMAYGNGPDDTGNGGFDSQEIEGTVGTTQANSIASTAMGVFFMSARGIYLLGSDLSVRPAGKPVADYSAYAIVAAMDLPDRENVWFFTDSGVILDFDYYHGIWGVHTQKESSVYAALVNGIPHYLSGTYKTYRENKTLYTDDSANITCKLITGWISLAQVQGSQRIRGIHLVGSTSLTGGYYDLTMKLYNDFLSSVVETFTINSQVVTASGVSNYQWNVKPKIQRCESIKLEISFAGSNYSAIISSLAFDVGALPGSFKQQAFKRIQGA